MLHLPHYLRAILLFLDYPAIKCTLKAYTLGLKNMIRTNAKEARQNFSHLLDQVEKGEEIFVLRRGHIIAHIIPHTKSAKKSLPNLKEFRSKLKIKGAFLSEMIAKAREKE